METSGQGQPGLGHEWQTYRSQHFVFRFPPDSAARKDISLVADRLEKFREVMVQTLNLGEVSSEQVYIYLSEVCDREGLQQDELDRDAPESMPRKIQAVYRADAPGLELEYALVKLMLTESCGERAGQGAILIDGVSGYISLLARGGDPTQLNASLAQQRDQGQYFALSDVLHGPKAEMKSAYSQVATSFIAYLIMSHGPERFKQFARQFDADAPDPAAEAAYGKSVSALEKKWLETLEEAEPDAIGVTGAVRLIFRWLRPYWHLEVVILLALLIDLAFIIIVPLSYQFLIDRAIIPGDRGLLVIIIAVLGSLFFINTLAGLLGDYITARLGARVMNDMRRAMFTHMQRLSMDFYARTRVGDLISRLSSDLETVEEAMTTALPMAIELVLTLLISCIMLFVLEWRLALITLAVLPIFIVGPKLFGDRAARASYQRQQDAARVTSYAQENLNAQGVVKSFGLQGRSVSRFENLITRLARSTVRVSFLGSLLETSASLVGGFIEVLALSVGAFFVLNDYLSLGTLVAFIALLAAVVDPLESVFEVIESLLDATGGMQRVEELLNEPVQVQDTPESQPLPRISDGIRFNDVTFSYTGEQMNLSEVGFVIPSGQKVGFVGASGCGKSTVLNLVMRFYDPTRGSVTIDGQDLRQVTQASLRDHIGIVQQDNVLFNDTIRENIRMGRLDATDEEVEVAAGASGIHDCIMGFPQGYDTVVGERGGRLSGGQRQRIAIARAILRDPPILLLDEATSALDPAGEAAINATLEQLAKDRTVLCVTHRLSSVINADRIFVLDNGQLVEQGTHEKLLKHEAAYSRLWQQQNGFIMGEGGQYVAVEAERLQLIPMFKDMDRVLLAALASRFVIENYSEDEIIFEEGDAGDKFYIIVRGHVDVLTSDLNRGELRLASLRDGEYFGEIALLEDVPRTATIRTRAPTVLLALEREQFQTLLNTIPDLRNAFEQMVKARRQANLAALRGDE